MVENVPVSGWYRLCPAPNNTGSGDSDWTLSSYYDLGDSDWTLSSYHDLGDSDWTLSTRNAPGFRLWKLGRGIICRYSATCGLGICPTIHLPADGNPSRHSATCGLAICPPPSCPPSPLPQDWVSTPPPSHMCNGCLPHPPATPVNWLSAPTPTTCGLLTCPSYLWIMYLPPAPAPATVNCVTAPSLSHLYVDWVSPQLPVDWVPATPPPSHLRIGYRPAASQLPVDRAFAPSSVTCGLLTCPSEATCGQGICPTPQLPVDLLSAPDRSNKGSRQEENARTA